ncbi:MAG: hypothetical protein XU12_C0016G0017 [Deltaproteobacteria bacterium CSP1-8]|nr:MAG: hypothetical protein XU12_C0016G0017 [Deltaproteobacteria bacterium CSP1-8]
MVHLTLELKLTAAPFLAGAPAAEAKRWADSKNGDGNMMLDDMLMNKIDNMHKRAYYIVNGI